MSLICIACGNREFFESDVETVMELESSKQDILVQAARVEDWNYAEDSIRDQVKENVLCTLKMNADEFHEDYFSGDLHNSYLQCSVCHSASVCRPFSNWQAPQAAMDLNSEMIDNRKSLTQLRKKRRLNENILPVLWQP